MPRRRPVKDALSRSNLAKNLGFKSGPRLPKKPIIPISAAGR
jgi:hypothetical protein